MNKQQTLIIVVVVLLVLGLVTYWFVNRGVNISDQPSNENPAGPEVQPVAPTPEQPVAPAPSPVETSVTPSPEVPASTGSKPTR
jgi:flagellar basal body-associated protein FliL